MALSRRVQRYGCKTAKAKEKLADSLMSLSVNIQSAVYIAVLVTSISLIITSSVTLSISPQAGFWQLSPKVLLTALVVGLIASVPLLIAWIFGEVWKQHALNIYDDVHSRASPDAGASPIN
jgi:hypothetical protein